MKLEDAKQVALRLKMPPDAHPASLPGASASADTGRSALATLYNAHAQVLDAEAKIAVERQPELAGPARDLATRTIKAAAKAIDTLNSQRDHFSRQITVALTPKVSDVLQAEVRAHFKSKGSAAFSEALALVRAGDPAALAVLSGPAFLSGMDQKSFDLLRQNAETTFAPEAAAGRAEAEAALVKVKNEADRFTETMSSKLRKWSRGQDKTAAEILGGV